MSRGMTLTGVGAVISAAHQDRAGNIHGHTWEVLAWWPVGKDALTLQRSLQAVVSRFDHSLLPDELASGEALAAAIGNDLHGCIQVDIARPAERIFARWIDL